MGLNFLARSARKEKGWTQSFFSKKIGVPVLVLGKFEMGETVDPVMEEKILRALSLKSEYHELLEKR